MAWTGLPPAKANELLTPVGIQIDFVEEEGIYVASRSIAGWGSKLESVAEALQYNCGITYTPL